MVKHDAGRTHRQRRELKQSQFSEIRDSFDLFDADGLGTIRATDLVRARGRSAPSSTTPQARPFRRSRAACARSGLQVVMLRALGSEPSKLEVKRFLADVDGANTGQLDFDGYLQIILDKLAERPTADEVSKAFRLFSDSDNENGRISFERLKEIGEHIGEQISDEELREMIAEADTSGTGLIGNDDFVRIVTSRHRTA